MANVVDVQKLQDLLDKDVLSLIGGENLPQEKKEELYQKMAQTIENRVIARIDDSLNEEEKAQWLQIIDSNDKVKMEQFLREKNIDVAKMMVEEALIYKTEITSLFEQSKVDTASEPVKE